MSRETHLPALFQLFRQQGYDGVSLANIAQATGLGKASLYHHFPGGKDEMVLATLGYAGDWLALNVLQPLGEEGDAQELLEEMCDRLSQLYDEGRQPCILGTLTLGPVRDDLHEVVKQGLARFIEAIAQLLIKAGLDPRSAQERSEDAVVMIQGSLLVSRGLDDPTPFQRALDQLPAKLCAGI